MFEKTSSFEKWVKAFFHLGHSIISQVKCPNRCENDPFFLCVMDIDRFLLKNGKLMFLLSPQNRFLLRSETNFQYLRAGNKTLVNKFVSPLQVKSRFISK
jgi:hypothetical protein